MQALTQIWDSVVSYLPNLLAAVAILVLGWLVALVVAALVRAGLRRTTVDNRVAQWLTGPEVSKKLPVEDIAYRIVFYTIMLLVVVAFFEAVGLALLTEPLNRLLGEVFVFAPRLLAALLLLGVAWLVASALRLVVTNVLRLAKVDERLGAQATPEGKALALTKTLGDVVYWLVFLMFLPAILGALALEGLLLPVQGMIDELLRYIPNILSAAIILAVGWFVARIVQRIVSNLLAAVGADRLGQRVGLDRALGERTPSSLLGLVVYVLILIPVLVAALNALGLDAVTQPASNMLDAILRSLPNLFAAALVITVAYVVGRVVGGLIGSLLEGVGFDGLVGRLGLWREDTEAKRKPSGLVGYLVVVAILLFATIEAFELLGFTRLAELFAELTLFGGDVVVGLVVFALGLYLANLAATTIAASKAKRASWLAGGARVAILALAGAMALGQIGVANEIITLAFGLTLGAVAVALALAFGLGGREWAGRQLDEWRQELGGDSS